MKLVIIGLMDQLKGHYLEFARRWIKVFQKADDIDIIGYITSKSFSFSKFNDLISHEAFLNIFYGSKQDDIGVLRRVQKLFNGVLRGIQANLLIRRHRPDIAFYLAVDLLSFPIANEIIRPPKNVKKVVIIHRVPNVPGIRGKMYKISLRYIIRRSNFVVVLDPSVKEQIIKSFSDVDSKKIKCILDPHFSENGYSLDKDEHTKFPGIFVMVGMITKDKGAHIAVSAFSSLTKEFPDIKLIINGHIRDKQYKKQLYQIRAGKKNIEIIDRYISRQEYLNLIKQADCIVLPYTAAAGARSSGVLLDAISCDKPVILSSVPGFSYYHSKFGLGYICKPDDISSLALVISDLVNKGFGNEQAMAIKAVKRAHSIEGACLEINHTLEELKTFE